MLPEHQETEATLRIFVDGPPDDHVPTIQDDLFVPAPLPKTTTVADVADTRRRLIARLRDQTFAGFLQSPPLDTKVECNYRFYEDGLGYRFGFTPEEGLRLHGFMLNLPPSAPTPAPAMLMLRSPGATSLESDPSNPLFLGSIKPPRAKFVLETRARVTPRGGDGEVVSGPHGRIEFFANRLKRGRFGVISVHITEQTTKLLESRGIDSAVLFQAVVRPRPKLLEGPTRLGDTDNRHIEVAALNHSL